MPKAIPQQQEPSFIRTLELFLAAACRDFGLEVGILARIHDDRYTIVAVHCPDDSIQRGDNFSAAKTYCHKTIDSLVPVGFHHASETNWKTHPAYEAFELEAYLGARVMVFDKVWGTVNFSSLLPRPRRISDVEKAIVKRIADWIGGELEGHWREEQLRKALRLEA